MARFSDWLPIRGPEGGYYLPYALYGPACYELGIGATRQGVEVVYVGETDNVVMRMVEYATHGAHLAAKINAAVGAGHTLFCRVRHKGTHEAAALLRDPLLRKRQLEGRPYQWNLEVDEAR